MTLQTGILPLAAIVAEIIGTTALRLSEGFTRLLPAIVVVISYGASFYFLSLGLKQGLPLGLSYAIWSGLGTVGIVLVGVVLFQEKMNLGLVAGIALVIAGVTIINLFNEFH